MESVPSLDTALDEAARVHRAASALQRWMRAVRPSGALGTSKLWALAILQRAGPSTASTIAAELGVQPQSMTRLLADLQARGAIERNPDALDHRRIVVTITRAGTALLVAEVREQRERLARALHERLTGAERRVLAVAADLMLDLAQDPGAAVQESPPVPARRHAS